MSGELLRFHAISIARKSEAPEGARCRNRSLIGGNIGEHSQGSVVLVVESDEAEGLQGSTGFRHRSQHFSHAMDGGGLRLEGQFHEVSGRKWRAHLQQSPVTETIFNLQLVCWPLSCTTMAATGFVI